MDLMVWTWTGNILDQEEVRLKTNKDSHCCARWVWLQFGVFLNKYDGALYLFNLFLCTFIYVGLCWLQELVEAYEAEGIATGKRRLVLSAAVAAGKATIDAGYEIAEIAK